MANLKTQRKTLIGDSEMFQFDVQGEKFLVKNLSGNDCLVNFEPITPANEGTSILIPKQIAQLILSNENPVYRYGTDKIYIKGIGAIEVQVILW